MTAVSIVVPLVVMVVIVPVLIMAVIAAVVIVLMMPAVVIMLMVVIAPYVARLVFLRSDEIHRPVAGIIFTAVLAPVSCMLRRHVQIHRRWRGFPSLDDCRLRVHQRRRTLISNMHLSVNARSDFPRQYDVYIQAVCPADSDRCEQSSDNRN
jgi:hypothetical protein